MEAISAIGAQFKAQAGSASGFSGQAWGTKTANVDLERKSGAVLAEKIARFRDETGAGATRVPAEPPVRTAQHKESAQSDPARRVASDPQRDGVSYSSYEMRRDFPVFDRMERLSRSALTAFEANTSEIQTAIDRIMQLDYGDYKTKLTPQMTDKEQYQAIVGDVTRYSEDLMKYTLEATRQTVMFSLVMKSNRNFGNHVNMFLKGT